MNIALMIDQTNFNNYAPKLPDDWNLFHLGVDPVEDDVLVNTAADALIIDPITPIKGSTISKMKNLKIIHSYGVGYNLIDLEAAKKAGIYVCNNAGVNASAVAEHTIMLMLAVLRNYHEAEAMMYSGHQVEYKNRCFAKGLKELNACRVGLIGFGAIGKEVALRLKSFGCETWYYKPSPLAEPNKYEVTYHTVEEILSECDIVSLHLPVLPDTIEIINKDTLALMKPEAILINTSRGELVDQEALCEALITERIGGFAADTLSPEPVQKDNPVLNLPEEVRNKIALSPHIAGITDGTFLRAFSKVLANTSAALSGKRPSNIVNGL